MLKKELNCNKVKNELKKCGWNVDCNKDGIVRFYRETKKQQKSKLRKKPNKHSSSRIRSKSLQLQSVQSPGLKKLVKLKEDREKNDDIFQSLYSNDNQNDASDKPPIFKPTEQ